MKYKVLVISLLVISNSLFAGDQEGQATSKYKSFIGAWNLVSWVVTDASGQLDHPYGNKPMGQIIYTENGTMSAQLMHPGAALPDVSGLSGDAVLKKVASTFFAYYGTYSVDNAGKTVTHHVQGCISPSWVGTEQARRYRFLDKNHLELSVKIEGALAEDMSASGSSVLIWERIQ